MLERRLHPRFSIDWPVRIGAETGALHDALASNISLSGIDLQVTHAVVVAMARSGGMLLPGDPFLLFSRDPMFQLDDIGCRTVLVRRISLERYVVGASFAESSDQQEADVRRLIDQVARAQRTAR